MLIRRAPMFRSSEITDERLYMNRRRFIAGAAALGLAGGAVTDAILADIAEAAKAPTGAPLKATRNAALSLNEPPTKIEDATSYNNFYEFGSHKQIATASQALQLQPWSVTIDGIVERSLRWMPTP